MVFSRQNFTITQRLYRIEIQMAIRVTNSMRSCLCNVSLVAIWALRNSRHPWRNSAKPYEDTLTEDALYVAACASRSRMTIARLLMRLAVMTPVATIPTNTVETALISGVTPRRTWE